MKITAQMVKGLRERTGAGMMECKKALVEAEGNIDLAAENLRKSGAAKADKKAGRIAAEGVIAYAGAADGSRAVLVEVNCETDFVGGGVPFRDFANATAQLAVESDSEDAAGLLAATMDDGRSVDEARRVLISKIGENVSIRRIGKAGGAERIGSYVHGNQRIGVLVGMEGGSDELAKDIAMHVAASNPVCISSDDVPAERLEKERNFLLDQARQEGKPEEIVEKMVEGRLRKYLREITLLGQPFVRDPEVSIEKLLAKAAAEVVAIVRFEVGEGIEKSKDDFAGEVMAAVRGE